MSVPQRERLDGEHGRRVILATGLAALGLALAVRGWNALAAPLIYGHDTLGHLTYALFLDCYRALPQPDQGWSLFHPPLHYWLGAGLARAGDPEAMMRGILLLSSTASLATAAAGAWIVAKTRPALPGLAWLAFAALALQPVHLSVSAMPGNELTAIALGAASLCVFVANELRAKPHLLGDAIAGALAGLACLAKANGAIPLLALLATLGLQGLLALRGRRPAWRPALRAALLLGAALAAAAPYYAKEGRGLDALFVDSEHKHPLVAAIESRQPPGSREWLDYLRFPPALFVDSDPGSAPLLRSVWGTVYADVWGDVFREGGHPRAPARRAMIAAGLVPTLLALWGAFHCARDLRCGRRRALYTVLMFQGLATLAAFAWFSGRVPTFAALKGSYLLGLSLPYAVALARGVEDLAARGGRGLAVAAAGCVLALGVGASALAIESGSSARRSDTAAAAAVHFYFGEYAEARRIYGYLAANSPRWPLPWIANLAAVELAAGRPEQARDFYRRAVAMEERGWGRALRRADLAAAQAVAGEWAEAEAEIEELLSIGERALLRANRGAIRAVRGELDAALDDLRAATAADAELLPAWLNLAAVHERRGESELAERARENAAEAACGAPRGFPYAVGTGEIVHWGVGRRWQLRLEGDALLPATPAFLCGACAELGGCR